MEEFKFIKSVEEARDIFEKIFNFGIQKVEDVYLTNEGHYCANVLATRKIMNHFVTIEKEYFGEKSFFLKNDFEIDSEGDINSFATKCLREEQTIALGEEYVDALEEYLNKKARQEIKEYRKILSEKGNGGE